MPRLSEVAGDGAELLRALYQSELPYVWAFLVRLGVPPRDVEDLVHDVFVAVWRQIDAYDRARPARPWLLGIAFRTASNYRRLHRVAREVLALPDVSEVADGAPMLDERLDRDQRNRLLAQALDTLDLERRAVFVMHDLDGLAMPEIAAALGVPLNTAYSRLRLARSQVIAVARRLQNQRRPR